MSKVDFSKPKETCRSSLFSATWIGLDFRRFPYTDKPFSHPVQFVLFAAWSERYGRRQVIDQMGHTQLVDWWGLGVLLYELMAGPRRTNDDSKEGLGS